MWLLDLRFFWIVICSKVEAEQMDSTVEPSQTPPKKPPGVNEIKAAINMLKEERELGRVSEENNRENVFCAHLERTEKWWASNATVQEYLHALSSLWHQWPTGLPEVAVTVLSNCFCSSFLPPPFLKSSEQSNPILMFVLTWIPLLL